MHIFTYIGEKHEHVLDLVTDDDAVVVEHQEESLGERPKAGLMRQVLAIVQDEFYRGVRC